MTDFALQLLEEETRREELVQRSKVRIMELESQLEVSHEKYASSRHAWRSERAELTTRLEERFREVANATSEAYAWRAERDRVMERLRHLVTAGQRVTRCVWEGTDVEVEAAARAFDEILAENIH